MRTSRSIAVAACAGAILACVGSPMAVFAQTPGYHVPGHTSQTDGSYAAGLSADGRVVAGISQGGLGDTPGFVWSESTGRNDFGLTETLGRLTRSAAISGDGTTVVGQRGGTEGFRWSGAGTLQRLGFLESFHDRSDARGVSGDGSVVVGLSNRTFTTIGEAYRWTAAGGMEGLGYAFPGQFYSEANAISRDGNVIVGMSQGANQFAVAWTAGTIRVLAGPSGSIASGTNHDGSRIVGSSYDSIGLRTAALWMGDTLQLLPAPSGPTIWRSWATDLSDDGSVIVGTLDNNTAGTRPSIWTPTSGWVFAADYFAAQEFPVPVGWTVNSLTSVSADGRTFCGTYLNGVTSEAFVLTVPAPSSLMLLIAGALGCPRKRSRRN